jgi:hypothetical protein
VKRLLAAVKDKAVVETFSLMLVEEFCVEMLSDIDAKAMVLDKDGTTRGLKEAFACVTAIAEDHPGIEFIGVGLRPILVHCARILLPYQGPVRDLRKSLDIVEEWRKSVDAAGDAAKPLNIEGMGLVCSFLLNHKIGIVLVARALEAFESRALDASQEEVVSRLKCKADAVCAFTPPSGFLGEFMAGFLELERECDLCIRGGSVDVVKATKKSAREIEAFLEIARVHVIELLMKIHHSTLRLAVESAVETILGEGMLERTPGAKDVSRPDKFLLDFGSLERNLLKQLPDYHEFFEKITCGRMKGHWVKYQRVANIVCSICRFSLGQLPKLSHILAEEERPTLVVLSQWLKLKEADVLEIAPTGDIFAKLVEHLIPPIQVAYLEKERLLANSFWTMVTTIVEGENTSLSMAGIFSMLSAFTSLGSHRLKFQEFADLFLKATM